MGEYALIRRAADEPFFGVQLAGTNPEELLVQMAAYQPVQLEKWLTSPTT